MALVVAADRIQTRRIPPAGLPQQRLYLLLLQL
jgi:hypothetical protein